jgi:hypothetical protein
VLVEAEDKRRDGKKSDAESGKDAVGSLEHYPNDEHDSAGQKQVRLHGAKEQSCSGKKRPRLVEEEKKNYAEENKDAKLPGQQASYYGREVVTEEVQAVLRAPMQGPKHANGRHETGKQSYQPEDHPGTPANEAEWQCQEKGHRRIAHDEGRAQVVSRRSLQRIRGGPIVRIRAMNKQLSGSPIADEIIYMTKMRRLVVCESENGNPCNQQAKRR